MNTVLLMYHCRRIRREIQSILKGRCKLIAAHGVAAVERLLRTHKPDVILVDQGGRNGTANGLLARLRRNHLRMPVVALSRSEASHDAMLARRLGASAVVRWPGPVKRLFGAIAKAASRNCDIPNSPI